MRNGGCDKGGSAKPVHFRPGSAIKLYPDSQAQSYH